MTPTDAELGERTIRKIALRIIPLLGFVYVVSFIDRVNIGFAALTMNKDLGIDASTYGLAAGVFFIGYLLFQVPGNLIIARLGARRWLATIMVLWGLVTMAMAWVNTGTDLVIARFFLGVAEAGFFPGSILFLTLWFPPAFRGRIVARFMFAAPIANIIGAPLSGWILGSFDGWLGFAGWQWLFVVEGLPAVIGAPLIYFWLQDRPETTTWLSPPEKEWLIGELAQAGDSAKAQSTVSRKILNIPVGALALTYFGMQVGIYGIVLWLPQIISEHGFGPLATGFIALVPYLAGGLAMLYWGSRADRRKGGPAYVWAPILVAAAALALSAFSTQLVLSIGLITVMSACMFASLPTFWAYSTTRYGAVLGAVGIAVVNAAGSLGGFAGPTIVGEVRDWTGSFAAGLFTIAALLLTASATFVLLARSERSRVPE